MESRGKKGKTPRLGNGGGRRVGQKKKAIIEKRPGEA